MPATFGSLALMNCCESGPLDEQRDREITVCPYLD
jgi:hypothetical protein